MTQLVEHVILDIGFVSLSPMLGRVYFKKTNKPEFSFSFFSSEKLRDRISFFRIILFLI